MKKKVELKKLKLNKLKIASLTSESLNSVWGGIEEAKKQQQSGRPNCSNLAAACGTNNTK